jgi:nicotinamide riboside kinase
VFKDRLEGYYAESKFLKNKITGQYDKVTLLYDINTLIGIFSTDTIATRYWNKTYVPSGRTKLQEEHNYVYLKEA